MSTVAQRRLTYGSEYERHGSLGQTRYALPSFESLLTRFPAKDSWAGFLRLGHLFSLVNGIFLACAKAAPPYQKGA